MDLRSLYYFARSLQYKATVSDLGVLDISESLQVTITASTSIYEAADLKNTDMKVTFKSSTQEVVVPLDYTENSNFFTGTVTLQPDQFNVKLNMTYDVGKDNGPKAESQIRRHRHEPLPTGPDTVNGAAVRATIFGGTPGANLSIDIRDCEGGEVKLYDAKQWQQMTDAGDTFFVPFFCAENSTTTAQCAAGTQSKYHVQ
ncbi:hypothetical protein OSTOST_07970, partial [Ostertagia ostertagi]